LRRGGAKRRGGVVQAQKQIFLFTLAAPPRLRRKKGSFALSLERIHFYRYVILCRGNASMGHGVKHVVHTKFVSLCGHCDWIVGIVGMLPGIAHIHIEIDGDHEMALIIVDPAPVLRAFHLRNGCASEASQVPIAWNLDASIQIKEAVHNGIAVGNLNDVTIGKYQLKRELKDCVVTFSVKVIYQQKTTSKQVFSQCRCFLRSRLPVSSSGLLKEKKRIEEQSFVRQFQVNAVIRYGHICHAAQGRQKMTFRKRVIDAPPRLIATMRPTAARCGVDDSRHVELALWKILDCSGARI
jgi:hypothetical protein